MKNLRINWKRILAASSLIAILATASSCSKKVDCNVKGYHLHKYVNNAGYVRYIDKEFDNYECYERQEEYITVDQSKKDIIKYMDDRNLLKIDDNIEKIKEAQEKNKNFTEYRYSYTITFTAPFIHFVTNYEWTRNKNHSNLTGETRERTYLYSAYKIEKDEYGNYVLIPSPEQKDILKTKDEYPYIKEDYYYTTIVKEQSKDKGQVLALKA